VEGREQGSTTQCKRNNATQNENQSAFHPPSREAKYEAYLRIRTPKCPTLPRAYRRVAIHMLIDE
jgi:hypothetical protein